MFPVKSNSLCGTTIAHLQWFGCNTWRQLYCCLMFFLAIETVTLSILRHDRKDPTEVVTPALSETSSCRKTLEIWVTVEERRLLTETHQDDRVMAECWVYFNSLNEQQLQQVAWREIYPQKSLKIWVKQRVSSLLAPLRFSHTKSNIVMPWGV